MIAIILIPLYPIGWPEALSALTMWFISGIGITVGFHRHFTHRAFQAGPRTRVAFAILGMMAAPGPLISWVAIHRRHHELSDEAGDPHSPHLSGQGFAGILKGLWHAQIGWMTDHEYPNPVHYAGDLLRDPQINRVNRMYYLWVLLGLILPAITCGLMRWSWWGLLTGFAWGGIVRLFMVQHLISSVNSVCHYLGSRMFDTPEHSTNNVWLAVPTLGEAWHNNHHAFQTSAVFGLRWWQIDIGGIVIRLLNRLGLAWDVRIPDASVIEIKRRKRFSQKEG